MKERPILFNGPMVRAILAGRKTQTRRVVKPQPPHKTVNGTPYTGFQVTTLPIRMGYDLTAYCDNPHYIGECPYGQPGDRLWVRETWRPLYVQGGTGMYEGTTYWAIEYRANKRELRHLKCIRAMSGLFYVPEAGASRAMHGAGWWPDAETRWRPSIHMPRWASRITLEVVSVRVERVQDISEADAVAEGVKELGSHNPPQYSPGYVSAAGWEDSRKSFAALWDSINGKRPGCGWDDNPFVWCVEFKREDDR